ncbi:MAG: DUF2314 domain-containing protein [Mucilaginibacter sp.]
MKRLFFILLVFIVAGAAGQTKVENNTEYKSVALDAEDSTFLALKDTAHKHLDIFLNGLSKNGTDTKNYRFLVKSDFVENGVHEHMWSQAFRYDKDGFKGIFIDSPFQLKHIKTGDKITIKLDDLEDWSIEDIKNHTTQGYYSEKYLNSKQ